MAWDSTKTQRSKGGDWVSRDFVQSIVSCCLKTSTTRQRLYYICEFYKFALSQGWIDRLPYTYEERLHKREIGFLAHTDASGGRATANDLMPRRHQPLTKFLSLTEIKAILASVENPHHRMVINLALRTGLRREELASFPLSCVFNPDKSQRARRNIQVYLDPFDGEGTMSKGSKPRKIHISCNLMDQLYHYATKIRGERASLSKSPQRALFLNKFGEAYRTDGKSLNRIISNAGKLIGINVHTHMLRHSYATHNLATLQQNPANGLDPLVFLQRELGHSSIHTTMIYLHLVNEIADNAILAFDEELNSFTEVQHDGKAQSIH